MSEFTDFLSAPATAPQSAPAASGGFQEWLQQPDQMTGVARQLALPASSFFKGLMTGPGAGLDEATAIEMGLPSDAIATPQSTAQGLKEAGLADRADLKPQNEREKFETAGFEGMGQAAPFAVIGGVPALASGFGGGVGSHYGAQFLPSHPIIGSLLGGLLGGIGGGAAANAASRASNALLGNFGEMGQAYKTAGVPMRLTGDVSENPLFQRAQAFAMNAPGGAGATRAAANQTVNAFGNSVEDTASGLGAARTPQDAGTVLQQNARDWLSTTMPAKQAAAWAPVDAAVGSEAPVTLSNYQKALTGIQGQVGRLQKSGSLLRPGLPRQLSEALAQDLPEGAPATWAETQQLRSLIGDARGTPSIVEAIGDKNLSRLYGALTSDMREAAATRGAGDAFDAANQASTKLYNFADNVVGKVLASKNPAQETVAPEQAANRILGSGNNGDFLLGQIRQEMPQAADALAAYKLRDMALANPGQQGATGESVSPGAFLTDWNRLSPEAKNALYPDPAVRGKIDALAKISQGIRQTQKDLNTSHTGSMLLNYEALRGIGGALGAIPGYLHGGLEGGAAGAFLGEGLGNLAPFGAGYAARLLAANRLLAPLLAARGARGIPGQNALLGGYTGLPQAGQPKLLGYPGAAAQ